MKIAFWIWTTVVIAVAITLGIRMTRDTVYSGTDITFTTSEDYYVTVSTETVTMEAADDEFFALRNLKGGVVAGELQKAPLGWGGKEYFAFGPEKVPGGQWLIEKASGITVRLSSEATMTVVVTMTRDASAPAIFVLSVLCVLIWILGIVLVAR